MLNSIKTLSGDVIEIGVARGDNAIPISIWMRENTPDKTLFACDTFTGLPYTESEILCKGRFNFGDTFLQCCKLLSLKNVVPIIGELEKTLPIKIFQSKFCFAWVDVDTYLSTLFALRWLVEKMQAGGIIGIHDYKFQDCPGVEKAVNEAIDFTKFEILIVEYNSLFLKKKT